MYAQLVEPLNSETELSVAVLIGLWYIIGLKVNEYISITTVKPIDAGTNTLRFYAESSR